MTRHIDNIRRVRDAVGPDFDLIQESNCRLTMEQCLQLAPVLEELSFFSSSLKVLAVYKSARSREG